jgi:hypothetical protein
MYDYKLYTHSDGNNIKQPNNSFYAPKYIIIIKLFKLIMIMSTRS